MNEKINSSKEKNRIVEVYDRYMNDSLLYNRWSEENLGNKIIYHERYEHIVKLLNDFKILANHYNYQLFYRIFNTTRRGTQAF